VIEEPAAAVSEDQMQALLGDVATLADGTVESAGLLNPPVAQIRLDLGDLGIGQVSAYTIDETMMSEDGWCRSGSHTCEVLLDTATAMLGHEETPYGDRLWYVAKIGGERYGRQQYLHVRASTDDVPDGTTVADLGFDNYHAFREAIVTAVPDAEQRGEFAADELNDIVVAVAELSSATSGEFVPQYDTTVTGRVLLDGVDAFDVRASFDRQGNDLSVWTESCERGESDGKPCTELFRQGDTAVFASTYPNQGSRESLRYVTDLAEGTLIITFDNYMETSSGKVVGASLSAAGIDPDELVAVVVSSGLLD
jgi:hypothetical protein